MACYISSNENRFYVNLEDAFGAVKAIDASNRFAASGVQITQENIYPQRRDKTGTRTLAPVRAPLRRNVQFAVKSYLTHADEGTSPAFGPLVRSAMGGNALVSAGGVIESAPAPNRIRFTTVHGLQPGQAVSWGGEIRFVTAGVDNYTIELNAPFTIAPTSGSATGPTVTYPLGNELKSVSLFDFWSPDSAVQRIAAGSVVDKMKVSVNGDVHEIEFKGPACDLVDSASFESGAGQLASFPVEPEIVGSYQAPPVAGHLGQAWIGATPSQFFTITKASLELQNRVEMRSSEFGSSLPRCVVPGPRSVTFDCSLYERDDVATKAIYQAARTRSSIPVMLQLGQQSGGLMGLYVKSLTPEPPVFDDRESRLQWKLSGCLAQGSDDDELYIAFA